ncbi:response regulator [Malonomonas rubra]|uniref:response regulator n=1 Tax=Malonomonas rubra TaxID=57040 RepID=UPI0026EFE237|nr:response regulator [Malonomonas rubra]
MTKKLLLADDSVTIQKVIGIIFATEDYELHVCDDGNEALEKALSEYPDLVIADISMPGKDGFELCRAIKSDPRLEHTSVLLLPGTFEHFDESHAEAAGADGWISKPFESQALLDKVAQLLEAEPIRLGAAEDGVAEDVVDFSADAVVEETTEESAELQEAAIDEVVLGLDEVEEIEEPAVAEPAAEESADDIWDAVSFEEEELQPVEDMSVAVEADVMEEFSAVDELVAEEDSADLSVSEKEPFELTDEDNELAAEEPLELDMAEDAPLELSEEAIIADEEPTFEAEPDAETSFAVEEHEPLPLVERKAETFEEEEGILDLAEEDILEEEPVEEFNVEPSADLGEVPFVPYKESLVEKSAAADRALEFAVEEPTAEAAGAFEPEPIALVEQQLRELSDDELQEVVGKVAGPIIKKLAGEMLEQVVWEVVPDLAESMIREEIRKIRQGATE